jgi:transcription initiation factor TFIID subunit 2
VQAIDYFTVTYGSYPFSSYAVCFVDDLSADITKIASCTICSSRLLYPEEVLDPIDSVPRQLTEALASQWAGIFIVPREPADTWITVGISHFITDTFLRKLCGNNDFRFRQKLAADKVCELDVGRPSLSALGAIIHLDRSQLEFMELKAPLVLFTLDRRLIKASGSAGITRAISRLFLNAKIGDAAVSCIGTTQFQRMCEKFGHVKLDTFFQEWVYGAGCPRFVVTQRFNKKKLVIEMLVKQVQADQNAAKDLSPDTFIRDVREEALKIEKPPVRPLFTGSMTIRIHEADGTPYDYLAVIKEATVKLEIPYNTKYKRLKRNRRQNERAAAAAGIDPAVEGGEEALLYCFGDVLQSEEEMRDWRLSELGKEEEDRMNQESYEWIRMDADFEWICQLSISMPWYMFLSQMQQDRDVIAQYDVSCCLIHFFQPRYSLAIRVGKAY